jgi:hypothetical protein
VLIYCNKEEVKKKKKEALVVCVLYAYIYGLCKVFLKYK